MKKTTGLILAAALALAASISCTNENTADENANSAVENAETARIATWNLEWFGALNRGEDDIKRIAGIIRELDIDVLALEEITCPCTVEQLVAELDGYDYFVSPQRIPQKLALLWRKDRVDQIEFDEQAYDALRGVAVTGLDRELRQPLVFRIRINKFDFTLMVVHLKSIPEAERSVEIRNIQYDAINEWLSAELSAADAEEDIIIAGDFNSYYSGISSERLRDAGHVVFLTTALPEGEYSNIWHDYDGNRNLSLIDHLAVTPVLRDGEFERIEPIRDWDVELGADQYENGISDHLPLVAVFRSTTDND